MALVHLTQRPHYHHVVVVPTAAVDANLLAGRFRSAPVADIAGKRTVRHPRKFSAQTIRMLLGVGMPLARHDQVRP